eukprot:362011-Chlamydomonas_euryale.AAC.1
MRSCSRARACVHERNCSACRLSACLAVTIRSAAGSCVSPSVVAVVVGGGARGPCRARACTCEHAHVPVKMRTR